MMHDNIGNVLLFLNPFPSMVLNPVQLLFPSPLPEKAMEVLGIGISVIKPSSMSFLFKERLLHTQSFNIFNMCFIRFFHAIIRDGSSIHILKYLDFFLPFYNQIIDVPNLFSRPLAQSPAKRPHFRL